MGVLNNTEATSQIAREIDPDVIPEQQTAAKPPHLRPSFVLLVGLGGAFGTAARISAADVIPRWGNWPTATAIVNIVGAFLLGLGLEGLVRRGEDIGRRRILRLTIGTGFMGGFTTYSTLAVDTGQLLVAGHATMGLIYSLGSVICGVMAAASGIWVGAGHHKLVIRYAPWHRDTRDADEDKL